MKMSQTVIKTEKLVKEYEIKKREGGLIGSIKGIFKGDKKIVEAVKGIDLEIKEGELVGFIGPNGAGKTTTLKMLSGILYPTSGSVTVLGYEPVKRKDDFLKNISLITGQKSQLWWDLPVIDSLYLNKEVYEVSDKDYKRRLDELVDIFELEEILNQQTRKLSLGQRMKCELAMSLIHQPRIVFLDEPTIGLDVVMQKKLRSFIKEYNKKHNATILLTSHYMDDVKEICERVVIINEGKIVFDGSISSLINKYADYKSIVALFEKEIDRAELEKFAEVVDVVDHKVTFKVDRDKVSRVAGDLLNKYDIGDLDINEPRLEDIIERIFSNE